MEATLDSTTSAKTEVEYLKQFADSGANVIIHSPDSANQLTDEQFDQLAEEHSRTGIQAKNLNNANNFIDSLDQISTARENYDRTEKVTANSVLYHLIQSIYFAYVKFYLSCTKTAKQTITETLETKLKERGIKFKPDARCLTLCVALVFQNTDRRSEKYAAVIVKAIAAKVQPEGLADWLTNQGGVENALAPKPKAPIAITTAAVKAEALKEEGRLLFRATTPYGVANVPHIKGEVALMLGLKNEDGQIAIVSTLDHLSIEKCPPVKSFLNQVARRKLEKKEAKAKQTVETN
jgi:hypothetical protein